MHKIITTSTPGGWQNLQEEVGRILQQCGFCVEVEKKVNTVRGDAVLDVYAEENVKGRKYIIVCECKYWKRKIPQSVVHSFRTILGDMGANVGYIVSMVGFQPGAKKAVTSTNLRLVTWHEFQKEFCDTWITNYLSPVITYKLEEVMGYLELLPQEWMLQLNDNGKKLVNELKKRYIAFGVIAMAFSQYSATFKGYPPKLPLVKSMPKLMVSSEHIPKVMFEIIGYRDLLCEALKLGENIADKFRHVKAVNML